MTYPILTDTRLPHPTWYCLFTAPQREKATREHLRKEGIYAFYPSRERCWKRNGKTYSREVPEVTSYVFARFRRVPNWFILKERRRLITGVLAYQGQPWEIHRDVIRHLQGLTVEAQKLAEARREMLRVREGDRAVINRGPLQGFLVEVEAIDGGEAILRGVLGMRGRADLTTLERIIPSSP